MFDCARKKRGSLLFETFIALAFLAIAITGILRLFGESLYVSRQNEIRRELNSAMSNLMFPWFANPGVLDFLEGGDIEIPLETGAKKSDLWCGIHSTALETAGEKAEESGESKNNGTQNQYQLVSRRTIPDYYKVKLKITQSRAKTLAEFETVLFKWDSEKTGAANIVR